jgi:hypothetical protein
MVDQKVVILKILLYQQTFVIISIFGISYSVLVKIMA